MSRSGNFVVTDRQADKTDYVTPCACAWGNKISEFQINKIYCDNMTCPQYILNICVLRP
jgi:hypothetical protein